MKRPTSAVAAAVTAITLGVSGMVMAALDDERPLIVRSASDAAPFTYEAPTTEPRVESTTTTEGDDETSTTTARRAQSPSTTVRLPVETEEEAPVEEATTTTSTPPTTSAPSRWTPPWEENYPTTTTTTTPPEKEWVEIARFEWTDSEPEIMRAPVTLETGIIRVRTSYTRFIDHIMAWFDDGSDYPTQAGCRPTADNPGTVFYSTQPWSESEGPCAPFQGPWPTGDKVIDFGKYDYQEERWRGPSMEGTHILWVEELR